MSEMTTKPFAWTKEDVQMNFSSSPFFFNNIWLTSKKNTLQ